jgi:hypothetical protein
LLFFDKAKIGREMDNIIVNGVKTTFSNKLSDVRFPSVLNKNKTNIIQIKPLIILYGILSFRISALINITARNIAFIEIEIVSNESIS